MEKLSKSIFNEARTAAAKKAKIIAKRQAERADDVARNDMALGLMSLFRAGVRAGRRQEITIKQELEQNFAGVAIRVRGVELDCFDQDVFLSILALGLQKHDHDAATVPGDTLPQLKAEGDASTSKTIDINTNMGEILKMAGKSRGGAQVEAVRISLERLSMIIVTVIKGNLRGSQHLIFGSIESGDDIKIRLNWRLTSALLATGQKNGGSYASISMIERRALPAGVPRLVHAFLCAWRPAGGTGRITRGKITNHVYGPPAKDRKTQWRRNVAVGEALELIGQLPNWTHISLPRM